MKLNLDLAITELERSREQHATNAPIHEAAGDEAQAALCRQVAEQCRKAAFILERAVNKINELEDY